jgi:hypothetical protein
LEREAGTAAEFNDGLFDSATLDYTAIYRWRPAQTDPAQAVTFDFTPDTATEAATTVYQTTSQYYRQTAGTVTGGWTTTPYTRFVTSYPICSDDGGVTESLLTADGQDCGTVYVGTSQIGVQVQVIVTWDNAGETHTRTLEERIYDWKYAD